MNNRFVVNNVEYVWDNDNRVILGYFPKNQNYYAEALFDKNGEILDSHYIFYLFLKDKFAKIIALFKEYNLGEVKFGILHSIFEDMPSMVFVEAESEILKKYVEKFIVPFITWNRFFDEELVLNAIKNLIEKDYESMLTKLRLEYVFEE